MQHMWLPRWCFKPVVPGQDINFSIMIYIADGCAFGNELAADGVFCEDGLCLARLQKDLEDKEA